MAINLWLKMTFFCCNDNLQVKVTILPKSSKHTKYSFQNFGYYVLLTELPTYLANILHFDIKSNSLYSAAPYLCCWVVAVVAPLITDFIVAKELVSKTVARKMANTVATMGPGLNTTQTDK